MLAGIDRFVGGWQACPTRWDEECIGSGTVGTEDEAHQSPRLRAVGGVTGGGGLTGDDHCACAIAEQDACRAVVPIDVSAQGFRPDEEDGAVKARCNEAMGNAKAIDEPGTRRVDVKRAGTVCP